MFCRLFKYNLIRKIRTKEILFWSILFPIALGTLFYMTFGGYMDKVEVFNKVPVAYVSDGNGDSRFASVIKEMGDKSDSALLSVKKTTMNKAKNMLKNEDVSGIYYNSGSEIKLYVEEEGINPSILKVVLDQYKQTMKTTTNIASRNPDNIAKVVSDLTKETKMIKNVKYTDSKMDSFTTYYYSLIAMTCMFGCFVGVASAVDIKADNSPIGARRVVGSINKFKVLLVDIVSDFLVQFICTLFSLCYMKYVLKVPFGDNMPFIILIVIVGVFIGLATGFFIGSVGTKSKSFKIGLSVAVSMGQCFLSGLIVSNMYHIVEKYYPIINRINPASLITDGLYSLDIYDTYGRFAFNIGTLVVIAVLLCIGSFIAIRRERYASI